MPSHQEEMVVEREAMDDFRAQAQGARKLREGKYNTAELANIEAGDISSDDEGAIEDYHALKAFRPSLSSQISTSVSAHIQGTSSSEHDAMKNHSESTLGGNVSSCNMGSLNGTSPRKGVRQFSLPMTSDRSKMCLWSPEKFENDRIQEKQKQNQRALAADENSKGVSTGDDSLFGEQDGEDKNSKDGEYSDQKHANMISSTGSMRLSSRGALRPLDPDEILGRKSGNIEDDDEIEARAQRIKEAFDTINKKIKEGAELEDFLSMDHLKSINRAFVAAEKKHDKSMIERIANHRSIDPNTRAGRRALRRALSNINLPPFQGLDKDEFVSAFQRTVGPVEKKLLSSLFVRIDASCISRVTWDMFSQYIMLRHPLSHQVAVNAIFSTVSSCRSMPHMLHKEECIAVFPYHDSYLSVDRSGGLRVFSDRDCSVVRVSKLSNATVVAAHHVVGPHVPGEPRETADVLFVSSVDRHVRMFDAWSLSQPNKFGSEDDGLEHEVARLNLEDVTATTLTSFSVQEAISDHERVQRRWLAVGAEDGTVSFCDITRALEHFAKRKNFILKVSFTMDVGPEDSWVTNIHYEPEIDILFISCAGGITRLVDVHTHKIKRKVQFFNSAVNKTLWLPQARLMASASAEREIILWDPFTCKVQSRLKGHKAGVISMHHFEPRGLLLSLSWDKRVCVWDINRSLMIFAVDCLELLREIHQPTTAQIKFNAETKAYHLVLVSRRLHTILLVDEKEQAILNTPIHYHTHPIVAALANDEFESISTVDNTGRVLVWDQKDGMHKLNYQCDMSGMLVTAASFDLFKRRLILGSDTGRLQVHNGANGVILNVLHGAKKEISSICVTNPRNPNSRLILAAGQDGCIVAWPARPTEVDQQPVWKMPLKDSKDVLSVALGSSADIIATGDIKGKAMVWNLTSRHLKTTVQISSGPNPSEFDAVEKVLMPKRFSALITASRDSCIRFWGSISGRLIGMVCFHDYSAVDEVSHAKNSATPLSEVEAQGQHQPNNDNVEISKAIHMLDSNTLLSRVKTCRSENTTESNASAQRVAQTATGGARMAKFLDDNSTDPLNIGIVRGKTAPVPVVAEGATFRHDFNDVPTTPFLKHTGMLQSTKARSLPATSGAKSKFTSQALEYTPDIRSAVTDVVIDDTESFLFACDSWGYVVCWDISQLKGFITEEELRVHMTLVARWPAFKQSILGMQCASSGSQTNLVLRTSTNVTVWSMQGTLLFRLAQDGSALALPDQTYDGSSDDEEYLTGDVSQDMLDLSSGPMTAKVAVKGTGMQQEAMFHLSKPKSKHVGDDDSQKRDKSNSNIGLIDEKSKSAVGGISLHKEEQQVLDIDEVSEDAKQSQAEYNSLSPSKTHTRAMATLSSGNSLALDLSALTADSARESALYTTRRPRTVPSQEEALNVYHSVTERQRTSAMWVHAPSRPSSRPSTSAGEDAMLAQIRQSKKQKSKQKLLSSEVLNAIQTKKPWLTVADKQEMAKEFFNRRFGIKPPIPRRGGGVLGFSSAAVIGPSKVSGAPLRADIPERSTAFLNKQEKEKKKVTKFSSGTKSTARQQKDLRIPDDNSDAMSVFSVASNRDRISRKVGIPRRKVPKGPTWKDIQNMPLEKALDTLTSSVAKGQVATALAIGSRMSPAIPDGDVSNSPAAGHATPPGMMKVKRGRIDSYGSRNKSKQLNVNVNLYSSNSGPPSKSSQGHGSPSVSRTSTPAGAQKSGTFLKKQLVGSSHNKRINSSHVPPMDAAGNTSSPGGILRLASLSQVTHSENGNATSSPQGKNGLISPSAGIGTVQTPSSSRRPSPRVQAARLVSAR